MTLLWRIAMAAAACFVLMTAVTAVEINHQERLRATTTAELVARHLNLQLLRIHTGFDVEERFPDLDGVMSAIPSSGDCVAVVGSTGHTLRSQCGDSSFEATPFWLATAWAPFSTTSLSVDRELASNGTYFGKVVVTPNPQEAMARVWQQLRSLLLVTAMTVLAASPLVYIAVARALLPADDLIAGLNRFSGGDFEHRLPHYRLSEFHRIGLKSACR